MKCKFLEGTEANLKETVELLGMRGKMDLGPVIDTVNGIKAIEKGANYKLAASITFGNFYIASTGIDEDDIMDKDDYIVLFSMGATPDLIFHYVLQSNQFHADLCLYNSRILHLLHYCYTT